ncbi:MAG TPA: RNA-binding domain-containing protein [Aggregatilineales bacterium]|nr:RNA-binding domain-containing protein [Aggregatilineales bacterium]
MDLHLHTPGSSDFQDRDASYLDVLHRAELRGLDIISFTDHNTVQGYRAMLDEIAQLAFLVEIDRAQPEERRRLAEYRRLMDKILVLPGFEFTAMFGFHILGIFAPDTPVRQLEHILLSLNIPPQALDEGSSNVGASSDVLTVYRAINEAGGIVIAAHANSTHGVAMRGFDFGGQTKIAYTQDPFLHCLEVTDLDRRGRGTTSRFFDGTKPEYPRRMRCIQGSDSHRLLKDPRNIKNLGIGDRPTEVLLTARTFEALRDVLRGNDFSLTRPYRGSDTDVYDYVHLAREEGPSIIQSFHDSMSRSGGHLYSVVADVCAFANTNGGTVYVGVSPDITIPPVGVDSVSDAIEELKSEVVHKITPPLDVAIDVLQSQNKNVIRIRVPRGAEQPYAIDDNKIYVRAEAETSLAVRDEIVRLVRQNNAAASPARKVALPVDEPEELSAGEEALAPEDSVAGQPAQREVPAAPAAASAPPKRSRRGRRKSASLATVPETAQVAVVPLPSALPAPAPPREVAAAPANSNAAALSMSPRTGVEIVGVETRKGEQYHVMRDLRNGSIVKNVTKTSARRLWHYAIMERDSNPVDLNLVQWAEGGEFGLWKRYKRGGVVRYDLVQRDNNQVRVYYGVTDDGMHGPWAAFVSDEEPLIDEPEQAE